MARPIFRIIFPVFNTGEPLRRFLQQLGEVKPLLERLGVEVEFIVIDDASTDAETLDILQHAPVRLEVVRLSHNVGCCGGLHNALALAADRGREGDFMAWLDADGEHAPVNLAQMLVTVQADHADLSLMQLIWSESHMAEYDRRLQEAMGMLEARIILGPEHRWHQHCPGCWVVSQKFVASCEPTYRAYLAAYEHEYGQYPRWGEDMSFVACVHNSGGRVDYSSLVYSHMSAPNRPEQKVVSQYRHALEHLALYPKFFKK